MCVFRHFGLRLLFLLRFFFVSLVYFQDLTLSTQALFCGSLSRSRKIGPAQNKFWTLTTAYFRYLLHISLSAAECGPHHVLVLINSQDTRPTWCSLTVALILQRHPRLAKGSRPTRQSQRLSPPFCPPSMVLLPWTFVASVSPFLYQSLPSLNGLRGWSLNSVIQGVDSCSHVNVCSQACQREGPRPVPLCLPWSLNRLEVNGGPCAEVAGAWMEPPLTWHSHRGRTGPDHCDTC